MNSNVLIVLSDRGWVLEKFAQELVSRLPYMTLEAERGASIRYYLNYHAWNQRTAPLEVAFFTHLESELPAQQRFFAVARSVDHCVCHSEPSRRILEANGIQDTTVISPGVDTERLRPILRIGVVGRTYHTGRKGEHLVEEVLDVPGIEWAFTGSGWPQPSVSVDEHSLPAFYRSVDFVLVPSLNEAGPMCVPEALACGTPVIAPAIGWVPDFPHIPFKVGDSRDLRRVLEEQVAAKARLRQAVLPYSWDAFAERHDGLFRSLAAKRGLSLRTSPRRTGKRDLPPLKEVALRLHGGEHRSPGGPSTRVPRLAQELKAHGIQATVASAADGPPSTTTNVVHVFNVWSPHTALAALHQARRTRRPVVFSPILLDLSLQHLWRDRLPQELTRASNPTEIDLAFARLRASLRDQHTPGAPLREGVPGLHASVRAMVRSSDAVVALSEAERRRLLEIGVEHPRIRVIHNPVDDLRSRKVDDTLFARTFGVEHYALCFGRIEPRKNQFALAHALRETSVPLVLVGHISDNAYAHLLRRWQWPGLRIVSRLEHGSDMWLSALRGARVFAMPSWAEGGPLAALEAAAAGLPLVLSDHADEREYFEGVATFVDPADPRQIRSAILEAIHSPVSPRVRHDRQDRMQLRFGWARHVDATLGVYREVQCPGHSSVVRDVAIGAIPRIETEIVLDVTTLVNHSGRWTGISRVEAALVLALQGVNRNRLTLIAWSDRQRRFIRLPTATISPCALRAAVVQQEASATSLGQFPLLSRLVVCGSAWMQNPRYVGGLAALVETHRLRLTAVIHDVIPLKSPHWFPEHYEAKFRENLRCILGTASSVIVISKATASDVMQACTELGILGYPPMATWRLGDDLPFADGHPDELVRDRLDNLPFVLAVGAIHTRKNYGVLYQAWLQLKRCMPDRCPRLVIVGGTAWNGDETAKAFKGDVQIAHLVNILDDVDDATLRWLYENAALTVYPSLDEGWGLPVAESLRFGTPCIASAIPTMSEIAPELVETLDPHDPLIWATRIQLLVSSPLARAAVANRIRAEYRPITWAAAGKHLLACIEALEPAEALSKGLRDVVSLGIPLHLREEVLRGVRFIDGWGPAGDIGRWIVKDRATCIVGLEAGLAGPHLFAAEISLGPVVLSCVVEIWICDALVCTWLVQQGERRQHFAVFEPPHLHERCQLDVDLRIGDVQAAPVVSDASCPSAKLQVHAIALARLQDVRTIDSQFGKHAGALRPGSWYDFRRERLASAGAPTTDRGAFHESLSSRVILRVHDALDEELELEIGLRTESSIEHPTSLSIMVNSQEIVTCLAVHAGPTRIKARLPNAVRFLQDPITVDVFSAGHGKDTSTPRACSLLAVRFVGRSGPCGLEASELHHLDEAAPPTTKQLAALGPEWLIGDGALEWEGFEAILPVQVGGLALRLRFSVRLETEIAGLDHIDFIVSARRKVLAIHTLMSEMKTVDVLIPSSSANDAEVAELRLTLRPVASSGAPMRHRTVPRIRAQLISARYEDGLVFVYDDVPEPASEIYSISSADYNARRIDNQYNRTHSGRVLQEWDMRSRNADLRASSIGLFRPEDEGSWTDAKFARLQLSLPQSVKIPITVAVFARVFGTAKTGIAEVEVRFSSGSEAVWTYPDDDWRWHYVTVEPAAGGTIDWLAVDFVRRDAITPKEMSGANDSRLLGLYLQKIAIVMPSNDEVVH